MASPRSRNYFITINESAESYQDALDIIKDMKTTLYAYIVHDKDTEINAEGVFVPKKTHKHICVELVNGISFESMQKKLKGAHIEVMKYRKASYEYLIHSSPNSKEKYQYDANEIISNSLDSVKDIISSKEGARLFDESDFITYIAEGITTPYQFAKIFGLKAFKDFWKPYKQMIDESYNDVEMNQDIEKRRQEIMNEEELPF